MESWSYATNSCSKVHFSGFIQNNQIFYFLRIRFALTLLACRFELYFSTRFLPLLCWRLFSTNLKKLYYERKHTFFQCKNRTYRVLLFYISIVRKFENGPASKKEKCALVPSKFKLFPKKKRVFAGGEKYPHKTTLITQSKLMFHMFLETNKNI